MVKKEEEKKEEKKVEEVVEEKKEVKAEKKEKKEKKDEAKKEEVKESPKEAVVEGDDEDIVIKTDEKSDRYYEAVGRRKTSTARVRLFTQGEKTLIVNDKSYKEYFDTEELQNIAISSLDKMKCLSHFRVTAHVKGGGIHGQAEAIRHGISRGLVEFNPDFRKRLRRAGFLTRDPRAKERKKFGFKRARKSPQWSKR